MLKHIKLESTGAVICKVTETPEKTTVETDLYNCSAIDVIKAVEGLIKLLDENFDLPIQKVLATLICELS